MHRTFHILLILFFLLIGETAYSQNEDKEFPEGMEVRANLSWHTGDPLLGPGIGIRFEEAYRAGIQFLFRPDYAPRIYEEERGKLQYQEKRYAALLYLERTLSPSFLGNFYGLIGVSGGGALEQRRGFPERTLAHVAVVPRAGLGRNFGELFRMELEYRYSPQPALNGKEHRVGLRAGLKL